MQSYIDTFTNTFSGYWKYFIDQLIHPTWQSAFWWLLGLSVAVWVLELIFPWRKNQKALRDDFWLDAFYMFFNFFLFSLIGYGALSEVGVQLLNDGLAKIGINNLVAIEVQSWPAWAHIIVLFLVSDFVQWNVHRLLHRVPWLWEFHKVHHSVQQMGFAAHLRFHWMENVVYKFFMYIPLTMLGYGFAELFLVHQFTLAIGHLNHSNINISWGPLKYIFNSPTMHIWHHAEELPANRKYGVNFGLTLSLWDYLFGKAYIPKVGRDIKLGFDDVAEFPKTFWGQFVYPFRKRK